jgi:hypothetical protein
MEGAYEGNLIRGFSRRAVAARIARRGAQPPSPLAHSPALASRAPRSRRGCHTACCPCVSVVAQWTSTKLFVRTWQTSLITITLILTQAGAEAARRAKLLGLAETTMPRRAATLHALVCVAGSLATPQPSCTWGADVVFEPPQFVGEWLLMNDGFVAINGTFILGATIEAREQKTLPLRPSSNAFSADAGRSWKTWEGIAPNSNLLPGGAAGELHDYGEPLGYMSPFHAARPWTYSARRFQSAVVGVFSVGGDGQIHRREQRAPAGGAMVAFSPHQRLIGTFISYL